MRRDRSNLGALASPLRIGAVERIDGPLLFISDTEGVGWDDYVEVVLENGEKRHGIVVEVDQDVAVVEIFEGTSGIGRIGNQVAFTGRPLDIPVTDGWLGRICNGRGQPLDGGPPVLGANRRPVSGTVINPARREVPSDPVITGVSAIDGLATLVRGQKLPVFSVGGLPHLELAIQVAAQASAEGEPFSVIFAGMGITNSDVALVIEGLEGRVEAGEAVLFLNTADDPTIERLLTPRVALTVAEHLAFDLGHHVLVVLSDMTSYADAVRQLSSARGEVPSRRGYPGYLFTDLAEIYERCGRITGRPGSITEMPVLTMPAGDITHPVPDLTGYITEGQIVLSADVHARGIYPPVDALSSLSRLMRRGAGAGRTRDDHLAIAAQLLALLARARRASDLAALIGAGALSITERAFLDYATRFETDFIDQDPHQARLLAETLDLAWDVAAAVPARELTTVTPEQIGTYLPSTSMHRGAP